MLVPLVVLVVVTATPDAGELRAEMVTVDGGEVPTVAPRLTRGLAPLFAPELKADAGSSPDGGAPVVVTDPSLSVYEVNMPVEATMTGAAFALYLFVELTIKPTLEGDLSCRRAIGNGRCDPNDLTAFDRYSVGRSSPGWATFSDVALGLSLLVPAFYLGLESIALPTVSPWRDFADDFLIMGEAMALTSVFQIVLKFAFRRPRPIRYTNLDEPLTSFDAELSFPSGHTLLVASATTTLTTTVFLRHPTSPLRWVVLGAGAALTALTAFSRVESGYHFPTDVIVGSFLGVFCGFIVPYLHRKKLPVAPTASVNPMNGGMSFSLAGHF